MIKLMLKIFKFLTNETLFIFVIRKLTIHAVTKGHYNW